MGGSKLKLTKKSKPTKKAKQKLKGKEMNGNHAMDVDENETEEKNEANDVSMNGHAKDNDDVKLTKEQIQLIQKAINSAKNDEEFEKLEKILRSGRMPEGDWKKLNEQQNT